jgi:hypothetical protein
MKSILIIMLALVMSISLFSQSWTPPEQGATRIGVIGNIWHPIGVVFNQNFGGWGFYATAKSNYEKEQDPAMNQFNLTAGLSVTIFKNTSRSNYSDLLVGISYNTDPDNPSYENIDNELGVEILLMTPFFDRNFRAIGGWSSNSINWAEGITLGFAYQF